MMEAAAVILFFVGAWVIAYLVDAALTAIESEKHDGQ